MMNHRHYPRLLTVGATIALLVALLAFFARAAAAQSGTPDPPVRLPLG
jgi:hypothetical protein